MNLILTTTYRNTAKFSCAKWLDLQKCKWYPFTMFQNCF